MIETIVACSITAVATLVGERTRQYVRDQRCKRLAAKQAPINRVAGVPLPYPDDPRWRPCREIYGGYKIGDIRVERGIGLPAVHVGEAHYTRSSYPEVERYVNAVMDAQALKIAIETAERD